MAETIKSADLTKNKKAGTGFVNLQRVIGANTGSNLGQAVAGQTQQIANRVTGDVQKAGEQFQTKSQQAFQPFAGGQQFTQQAIAAPVGLTDQDVNRFRTITKGVYSGPRDLENKEALQAGVQNVKNLAAMGQTNPGRQALLGTLFQRPQYSTGQRRLDALLLQADPTQAQSLNQLQNLSAQTGRQFSNVAGFASGDAMLKEKQARELAESTKKGLTTEQELRDKEQLDKLASVQENERKLRENFNNLQNALNRGEISEEDVARLGLGDVLTQETPIYNLNLNNYLKTTLAEEPINVRETISKDEAARINALAKLGGMSPVYDDLTKIGTYKQSAQSFDVDKFRKDQAAIAAKAEQARKNIIAANQLRGLIEQGRFTPPSLEEYDRIVNSAGGAGIPLTSEMHEDIERAKRISDPLQRKIALMNASQRFKQETEGGKQVSGAIDRLRGEVAGYGINPDNPEDYKRIRRIAKY